MASVRSMSDDELHSWLLKIGITTPVTPSTRPILVKKLIQAKQDKKIKIPAATTVSVKRTTRHSLQSFSSDEEEEDEDHLDGSPQHSQYNDEASESEEYNEDDHLEDEGDEEEEEEEEQINDSYTTRSSNSRLNSNKNNGSISRPGFRFNSSITMRNDSNSNLNNSNNNSYLNDESNNSSSSRRKNKKSGGGNSSQASTGKLFPSVSPRSPRLKNRSKILDYDTASDNDEELLNSTGSFATSTYKAANNRPTYSSNRSDTRGDDYEGTNFYERAAKRRALESNESVNNSRTDVFGGGSFSLEASTATGRFASRYSASDDLYPSPTGDDRVHYRNSSAGSALYASRRPFTNEYGSSSEVSSDGSKSRNQTWISRFFSFLPRNKSEVHEWRKTTDSSKYGGWWWGRIWFPAVPSMLLLLLLLFFLLLGGCYISMAQHRPLLDTGAEVEEEEEWAGRLIEQDGLKLPICPLNTTLGDASSSSCLTQEEVSIAPRVLPLGPRVLSAARDRYNSYQCGGHDRPYVGVNEIGEMMGDLAGLKLSWEQAVAISALAKLSSLNPTLQLLPVYDDNNNVSSTTHDKYSSQSTATDAPTAGGGEKAGAPPAQRPKLLGLRTRNPQLHLLCALMNFAKLLMYFVALLALGGGVFYSVLYVVRWYQHRQECRQQQLFALVSDVVALVQGCSAESYAAIQHIRDHLFSPRQRLQNEALWRDTVQFVDQHESRIIREVRVVGGEETEVWRWIGQKGIVQSQASSSVTSSPVAATGNFAESSAILTPSSSIYPKLPVIDGEEESDSSLFGWWQGNGVTRSRTVVAAPTRCLKIRNLASNNRSPESVQRQVVQKCRGCNILHIAVDQTSTEGVVYLMADTVKAAGAIYSELHGCWFAGQLLSVKFLRDQRYLERFPAAAHCSQPLTA